MSTHGSHSRTSSISHSSGITTPSDKRSSIAASVETQIPPASLIIRRQCWSSTIPCIIFISNKYQYMAYRAQSTVKEPIYEEDKISDQVIEPLLLTCNRMSYFIHYIDQVENYFDSFVSRKKKDNEPITIEWYMYLTVPGSGGGGLSSTTSEQPIIWHYPIGVLWDLFVSSTNTNSGLLKICINFTTEPSPYTFRPIQDQMRSLYYSFLKQSDWLRWRQSCRRMHSMPRCEQTILYDVLGPSGGDYLGMTKWWKVVQPLLLSNPSFDVESAWSRYMELYDHDVLMKNGHDFGSIPIRLYRSPINVKMMAVHSVTDDSRLTLLSDVITDQSASICWLQGIQIPFDTPLLWLVYHLCYQDVFLHLVISSTITTTTNTSATTINTTNAL